MPSENNQPSVSENECVKEGELVFQNQECCSGLSQIDRSMLGNDNQCYPTSSAEGIINPEAIGICAKCGDGVCANQKLDGENQCNCPKDCGTKSVLNDAIVTQLVLQKYGDCANKCKTFSVNVNYNADIPYVAVKYDGMYDDSIKTEVISFSLKFSFTNNKWSIDEATVEKGWICQLNRGSQTLSSVPCI